jgi:glyoxylase I family protein
MIDIKQVLHVGILVKDTARSLAFYQGVLGMEIVTKRPDLGYPGVWLRVGDQQIHLMELPNPDEMTERPSHGGRDRHIALAISNLDKLQQTLDSAGIKYTHSKSGRNALFCRDPDGNALEFVAHT